MPKTQSERLIELLRYPEDTVGGIMTNDVISARASLRFLKRAKIARAAEEA